MIFPQAARDRFRRDLSNVIAVVRLPTGAESTWVALVRKDAADTSGLARFNRAAPNFLTWVLGKTRKDHRALLASQPASRAIIRSVIEGAPAVRTRATLDSLERVLWRRLAAEPEFQRHIREQLDRNSTARMFSYRTTPGRPWAEKWR